ncbi:MAG: hypothetical protein AAGF04_03915 [Chlamydiota bacterium]
MNQVPPPAGEPSLPPIGAKSGANPLKNSAAQIHTIAIGLIPHGLSQKEPSNLAGRVKQTPPPGVGSIVQRVVHPSR